MLYLSGIVLVNRQIEKGFMFWIICNFMVIGVKTMMLQKSIMFAGF
jgi:hypothetical protein